MRYSVVVLGWLAKDLVDSVLYLLVAVASIDERRQGIACTSEASANGHSAKRCSSRQMVLRGHCHSPSGSNRFSSSRLNSFSPSF